MLTQEDFPEGFMMVESKLPHIKNKKRTVMFYEGRDEKLIFRYNGKAAVCFVDGHTALVSPEEAKSLIWKP